jgi:hypothetical protein
MAIKNPITTIKTKISAFLDKLYFDAYVGKSTLFWLMPQLCKITPNRNTWYSFTVDSDYDYLCYGGKDIGILSNNREATLFYNENYNDIFKEQLPAKFRDMTNHLLQVAYMAAYFYPITGCSNTVHNYNLELIKSHKDDMSHDFLFQDVAAGLDGLSSIELNTLVYKRKDQRDLYISKFIVRSFHNSNIVTVFFGYDNGDLYYHFDEGEFGNIFNITPIDPVEITKSFHKISHDELFKTMSTDLIGFMTGYLPGSIPTYRDKTLLDMTKI